MSRKTVHRNLKLAWLITALIFVLVGITPPPTFAALGFGGNIVVLLEKKQNQYAHGAAKYSSDAEWWQ